ncbi:MAG: transglutaminase domain-containing protein, partial [Terriglobus sp.]
LYSDDRVRAMMPPAMDVGAIAAMEYEVQQQPYENDIIWMPGEDIPVLRERLTLNLPEGYTYKAQWKGKPKTQAVDAEHGSTLWEVANQKSLVTKDHVPLSPNQFAMAPRMDIFYQGPITTPYGTMTGDWKSIGEWYEQLAKGRNKPDPAITAKAQELVAGKTDFRDRVAAISNFVQSDIRYVAIEIGVGGNQPHAATDTFRARYGDCKDKATLLSAMLDAVGVRSTWVMVDTNRGMISSEAPSLWGNHMIGAIELPANYSPKEMYSVVTAKSGKRFLIFDPTWEKTPFGQLEYELQGSDALLVDGPDSEAIRLPVLKPELNHVQRKANFTLAADGSLSGTVTQEEGGDIARTLRELSLSDEKTQQQSLDRSLSRDLRAFHIDGMQMTNTAALDKNLELHYSLKAEHFAEPVGNLMTIRPRVLGTEAPAVDEKPRHLPIDLRETRLIQDDFTIALPDGLAVDELPSPVHLDLGFAAYTSESKVEGHAIHYNRTYTVREISLPADRYADVQKLARTIEADEQSSAVLKRAN